MLKCGFLPMTFIYPPPNNNIIIIAPYKPVVTPSSPQISIRIQFSLMA